jgi:phosphate transport system substrate-binding protein
MVGALAILGFAPGCPAGELPDYRPERDVAGTIRIWASPADGPLLTQLEAGFRRFHPRVSFADSLRGPESTLAGLYTGVADLAFMAREVRVPMETMAFEWTHHYKLFQVEVANAGMAGDRPGVNLAIFVHEQNPLTTLTLRQLDGIFGAETQGGLTNLRKWGDLAEGASWKDRPIHVYGPAVDSIPALYIRARVLGGSHKWNPEYREVLTGWDGVLAALAEDPDGIAFAPGMSVRPGIRQVELTATDGSPYIRLTAESVRSRAYPLTRIITVGLDRAPGGPIDAKLEEFLRYILSRDGQEEIERDGTYIPLDARSAQQQLARLD